MTRAQSRPGLSVLALLACLSHAHAARAQDTVLRDFDVRVDKARGAFFGGLQLANGGDADVHGIGGPRSATPLRNLAFKLRAEFPLARYLLAGLDLSLDEDAGVRIGGETDFQDIQSIRIDYGIHLKPRWPILPQVELYAIFSAGLSVLPWANAVEIRIPEAMASAEPTSLGRGFYLGAGIGVTTWLNERLGVFLEFSMNRRESYGTFESTSSVLPAKIASEFPVVIEEQMGAVVVGVGCSLGGP